MNVTNWQLDEETGISTAKYDVWELIQMGTGLDSACLASQNQTTFRVAKGYLHITSPTISYFGISLVPILCTIKSLTMTAQEMAYHYNQTDDCLLVNNGNEVLVSKDWFVRSGGSAVRPSDHTMLLIEEGTLTIIFNNTHRIKVPILVIEEFLQRMYKTV